MIATRLLAGILLTLTATACQGLDPQAEPRPAPDAGAQPSPSPAPSPARDPGRLLVFTATAGFRHPSIPHGVDALRQIAADGGFSLTATEDPGVFTDQQLAGVQALVFLHTTGPVLGPEQQAAVQRYLAGGGGFVGIHAAADGDPDWAWYTGLIGAPFHSHPPIQPATIHITDPDHPATRDLPTTWQRTDEWYDFTANPRGGVHVLATVDERTYTGGRMGADHPIAWCHRYQGGRAFYTALGHTPESFSEPAFLAHLAGGIRWAAGQEPADCTP